MLKEIKFTAKDFELDGNNYVMHITFLKSDLHRLVSGIGELYDYENFDIEYKHLGDISLIGTNSDVKTEKNTFTYI